MTTLAIATHNQLTKVSVLCSSRAEWASSARELLAKDSSCDLPKELLLQCCTVPGMVLICWVKAINISIHGSSEFFRGEPQLEDVLLLCGIKKHNWEIQRNDMGVRKEEIMVQIQHILSKESNGS